MFKLQGQASITVFLKNLQLSIKLDQHYGQSGSELTAKIVSHNVSELDPSSRDRIITAVATLNHLLQKK